MNFLTAHQTMWTAFIVGSSSPIILFSLYQLGYVSKKIIALFIIGVCVGFTWEIPFALAGESFHLILVDWPIDLPLVRNINYAFLDSLIFLIGILLCNKILKNDNYLYTFNPKALVIMIVWGSVSEFLIDLNCSGKLWIFLENWYNPVFVSINGTDMTLIPQLIWLVAPVVYYLTVLKLIKLVD
ncbi:MAG: hypothetical protein ACKVLG_04360 [Fidelibacterota bacterium]|jgi:hypothetical protein